MKPKDDEALLFAGKPAATALNKQAKKLLRQRDRKAFWEGRKEEKRNG